MKANLLFSISSIALGLLVYACKNADTKTTIDESPKAAVLAAVKVLVEKELTIPVTLKDDYFKAENNAAFVTATILKSDGSKMDFKGTPFDEQANIGGSFSDAVICLLKNENGTWKVKAITVGATDAMDGCWHNEFKVAKSLFPEGMMHDGCQVHPPSVFADKNRITVNGGIGLNLEEMKEELIQALLRMDKIPDTIEPSFGDHADKSMQGEVRTTIKEAITEAQKAKGKGL